MMRELASAQARIVAGTSRPTMMSGSMGITDPIGSSITTAARARITVAVTTGRIAARTPTTTIARSAISATSSPTGARTSESRARWTRGAPRPAPAAARRSGFPLPVIAAIRSFRQATAVTGGAGPFRGGCQHLWSAAWSGLNAFSGWRGSEMRRLDFRALRSIKRPVVISTRSPVARIIATTAEASCRQIELGSLAAESRP